MKKYSQDEVSQLISQLFGGEVQAPPTMLPPTQEPISQIKSSTYQLPVRVGQNGQPISDQNKPWIIGTFIPGKFVNERHPQGHNGVDLSAGKGTPIYPIGPGKVIETMVYSKGGNTVKIAHEDGNVVSYYAHMDSVNVRVGQDVDNNTIIGFVGDSGNAKGTHPHLHYEVKVNNNRVDPMSIVGKPVGSFTKKAKIEKDIIQTLEKFAKF
jgi:murein DD-endopeptidase MepM/ murein hydrolase activator NlpD